MSSTPALCLGLALAALTPGCIIVIGDRDPDVYPVEPPPDDTGGVACTDEARASVILSVTDFDGLPASDVNVQWSSQVSDIAGQGECADETCSSYVVAWEVAGPIDIWASVSTPDETDPYCWWSSSALTTVEVPMTADGCHVETQYTSVTLPLPSLECADVETEPETEPAEEPGEEPVDECDGPESDCG